MKKSLSLFILVFAFAAGNCQQKLGLRSGANIATIKGLTGFPKNRLGWYAGLFFEQPFNGKFFMHLETIYTTKGMKVGNTLNNANYVFRFNYISIPILVGYKLDKRTSILAGLEGSYNTSVKWIVDYDLNLDRSDYYPRKVDAGVCVGINYNILKRLSADVRYVYGFKTIYNVDDAGLRYSEKEAGNRVFQIGMSYNFQ